MVVEAGRQVNSANGQNVPEADSVPLPPTSGHLMAEKMRLGRQDQEETEPSGRFGFTNQWSGLLEDWVSIPVYSHE